MVVALPGDALPRLAGLLWEERELLRRLQFNLVTQQLIIGSGQWQWMAFADDEIRATSERLQEVEVMRSAEAELIAEALGLPPVATLRQLADVAPEPWPSILADHEAALRGLTAAVDAVAARVEHLIDTVAVPTLSDDAQPDE